MSTSTSTATGTQTSSSTASSTASGARKRVTGPERTRLGADLAQQYAAGRSIRELASATGKSYGFIHRVLTESGAELRGRGGATRRKNTG